MPPGSSFAVELFSRLPRGNVVFSPLSIFVALAMTMAGARGATAAEMAAVLRQPADAAHAALGGLLVELAEERAGGHALRIANCVWLREGLAFLPAFVELLRTHYAVQPRQADYARPEAACEAINAWVSEHTAGRIRALVKPRIHVVPHTLLVLVNALYLKARWRSEFSTDETRSQPFRAGPGRTIEVPMMRKESAYEKFGFFDEGRFKLLELPYRGALSMVFALPEKTDGVDELDLDRVLAAFAAMRPAHVRIDLPRFRTEWECTLRETLCAMGMPTAFDASADFSAMTADAPVMIGEVVHKAFVAVDEEGTEAAAATAVVADVGAVFDLKEPTWQTFRADHPFLFFVRARNSGIVLFMGRVAEPTGT